MPAPAIEIDARRGQPLGMSPARFLRDYWQKRPLLVRGAFPGFTSSLSPDELAGLACMDGALARIVRKRRSSSRRKPGPHFSVPGAGSRPFPGRDDVERKIGMGSPDDRWEVRTGPFDDATFAQLPESGWTLLVQDVDKWDTDTAALLGHFTFIPSWRIDDVMISYAVDGGGVGAHVDQYDVFLLQAMGARRWSIDARPHPSSAFRDDVELKLLREFHPTHDWVLEPGDMLYLPPGVPHDGVAVGECMTYSIGMRAPAASELMLDFAAHVAERLPETQRYVDPDLAPAADAGEIDAAALARARRALGGIATALDDDAFADWFGTFITRYRAAQASTPRQRPCDRAALDARLPRSIVERDPSSRIAWRRCDRGARLYVAGAVFDAPLAWARAFAGSARELDGRQLAKLPQRARGIAVLADLIDAGHLRLLRRRAGDR